MTGQISRRAVLAGAAGGGLMMLPGKAPAQGGRKRLDGVTLNVSCWSATYPKLLAEYIPEFEKATGAKVNYETPSFPIYNQRMDLELSTGSAAYDVVNVTFIYIGRWIGAGWITPLDSFIGDSAKTPADWGADDFLAGTTTPFKDRHGRLCAIPWIADVYMAGASRYDLIQKAGLKLPDNFAEMESTLKAVNKQGGIPAYVVENHYGWSWIPYLQGMGGQVFRNPPDDLMPVLDSPEAIAAADLFGRMMRNYGPDGVLSYTYDQVLATLKQGRANYSTNNQAFLVQMAQKDSKVSKTSGFSSMPAGPKGRFPGLATHGWGIPAGSKQKDAAWEFILWAMSKDIGKRMFLEKGYSSVTRRSIIEAPEFNSSLQLNGFDVAKIYLDSIQQAASGYMAYRTVPVYPQVDREIDAAIQSVISQQKTPEQAMKQAQENAIAQIRRAGVKL
jgi:multiple sugar transport system substrate-binding protein